MRILIMTSWLMKLSAQIQMILRIWFLNMCKIKLLPGLPLSRADRAPLEARRQRRPTVAFSSLPLSGQASLEMTVGLIGVFILLFVALNVFLCANKDIVKRQEYYEHAPDDADIRSE